MKLVFVLFLILTAALPAFAADRLAGKKLIEYGWDCPDTAFVREHIREMEKVPFDGVVIQVKGKPNAAGVPTLGWETFGKRKFIPADYHHAIKDLQAARSRMVANSFIQVISMPGDVDWFDPEWSTVAHNAACLAKVAKLGGCRGIMFDPEMYGAHPIWSYAKRPAEDKAAHPYAACADKVRERGREFIRAINAEYPDIAILCLFGPALPYEQSGGPGGLEAADYSLLAAFYDGICEAAKPGTMLIDGYEQSYPFRDRRAFVSGRKSMLEGAKSISKVPEAFSKHVRAGFATWVDYASGQLGWHPDDFTQNYYTPAAFRASVSYGLEQSDGYVWVYSERLSWWDGKMPKEYMDALAMAKTGPGRGESEPLQVKSPTPRAQDQAGYSDEETFAEFRKTLTEVYDLPKDGWRFKREGSESGEKQGWGRADFDDSGWRAISIGRFWEEQGEDFDGVGWYRVRFTPPAVEHGKRVFLVFGAVDESAWVWLNGQSVGSHDIGGIGWLIPFKLDVTKALKPAQENVLAVKLLDTSGAGGIWKSVKVMTERSTTGPTPDAAPASSHLVNGNPFHRP